MVSTLDSESSDPSSSLGRTLTFSAFILLKKASVSSVALKNYAMVAANLSVRDFSERIPSHNIFGDLGSPVLKPSPDRAKEDPFSAPVFGGVRKEERNEMRRGEPKNFHFLLGGGEEGK